MIRNILTVFCALFLFAAPAMAGEGAPMTVEGTTFVNNEEAKALFDEEVLFIDTREDAAWELGRVPGAIHLNVKTEAYTKEALLEEIGLEDKVVIYCNGVKCGRSSAGCKKAVEWGFKNVYYYREGFPGWKTAGYPVE